MRIIIVPTRGCRRAAKIDFAFSGLGGVNEHANGTHSRYYHLSPRTV